MNALTLALDGLVIATCLIFLGQSVVVVHRGSGVINFAAGAIGVIGAYIFYNLWPGHGIWWPVALVIALAAAGAIGGAVHLLYMRRLRTASLTTKVIATLALMSLLVALCDQFLDKGGVARVEPSFLPSATIHLVGTVDFGVGQLITVGVALVATALLLIVQRRTRFGLATTAVCENPTVAAGMGWSPDLIATANWALGGALATAGMILLVPSSGLSADSLALLIVPALGAALIGRFDSVALTLVGGLVIGIGQGEVGLITTAPGWGDAAPLIVIVVVLLLRRPPKVDRSGGSGRLPLVAKGRIGLSSVLAFAVCLVLIYTLPSSWLLALTTSIVMGVALLSIVVLTGYAGQLSLAQFGLTGVGAFATAWFAAGHGWPLWAAMVAAVIVTVPIAMVVALPALRTSGVGLAVATLSLVVVINDLLLTNPSAATWLGTGALPPLEIFGYQLDLITHPQRYAVFVLIVAALVSLAVANLRRSGWGRRLLATRANPQAAASLGISPTAAKAYAFGVAAGIAAICGALLEAQLSFADFSQFGSAPSVQMILQSTVGGLGFIPGAFAGSFGTPGGLAARILGLIVSPSNWLTLIVAVLAILVLLQAPDGIVPTQLRLIRAQGRIIRQRLWPGKTDNGTRLPWRYFFVPPANGPTEAEHEDMFVRAARARGATDQDRRPPSRLQVTGLSVAFGGSKALDNVSLTVSPGEIVGLIGPNGAGKSTFIDAVTGFVRADAGTVTLDDAPIDSLSATQRARRGLARCFQSLELFEDMSVGENLLAASERPNGWEAFRDLAWPRRPKTNEAALLAVRDFDLEPYLNMAPRGLNHGKRRLVAIARAFAADPGLILLDEPAAGLDTKERAELGALIQRVAAEWNIGILLVEHDVNMVFRVCDRVVGLVRGQVVGEGTPEQMRAHPQLIESYLGTSATDDPAGAPQLTVPEG